LQWGIDVLTIPYPSDAMTEVGEIRIFNSGGRLLKSFQVDHAFDHIIIQSGMLTPESIITKYLIQKVNWMQGVLWWDEKASIIFFSIPFSLTISMGSFKLWIILDVDAVKAQQRGEQGKTCLIFTIWLTLLEIYNRVMKKILILFVFCLPVTSFSQTNITQNFTDSTIYLGPDFNLCQGYIHILDAGPGFDSYLWQDGSTLQTFMVTEGGTFWVQTFIATTLYADTINIGYWPYPDPDLGNDTIICYGNFLMLEPPI
jgi:hypothetical protein